MLSTMQDEPLSIAQLVRYGTGPHGGAEVVTWSGSGPRREDYATLGQRVAQLAHGLRALGITGDERIGTFMWNNAEHLEAYLAIPSMGAVLHTLNIRLHADQVAYIADHAEDRVILVDGSLVSLFARVLPSLKAVRHVVISGTPAGELDAPDGVEVHDYEDLLAGQATEFDWPQLDERSAAALCYTSGTTGHPKGVAYSHRSIWLHSMQVCMSDGMQLSQADRGLVVVPMFHAMSWGMPYAAMMTGAEMIMPDRFLQPEPLVRMLVEELPTLAAAVPTIWQGVLEQLQNHPADISSLRAVVIGGSAAPESMMRTFAEHYGVPVLQAWGMTETSPLGSVAHPPGSATGEEVWTYRRTQGRFPASVRPRLVDEAGAPLPHDGESVGELEVRGPWVTASYFRIDEPDTFDDGWLRTGDVGTIDAEGYLRLTDRAKDVIKSGGEWISSVDLENTVMAHPDVSEAVVIGVPNSKWGERPFAVVVRQEGTSLTADDLREYLAGHVARWQLPDHWVFLDEVPKTSTGKFDKKRLRDWQAAGHLATQES